MNFPRAIAISLIFHAAVLFAAHMGSLSRGPEDLRTSPEETTRRHAQVAQLLTQFGASEGTSQTGSASGTTPELGEPDGSRSSPPANSEIKSSAPGETSDKKVEQDSSDNSSQSESGRQSDKTENPSPKRKKSDEREASEETNSKQPPRENQSKKLVAKTDNPSPDNTAPEPKSTDTTPVDDDSTQRTGSADEQVNSASETTASKTGGSESANSPSGGGTTGSGSDTGDKGQAAGAGSGPGNGDKAGVDKAALRRGYNRSLFKFIEKHKEYPELARRAGMEGRVLLDIVIHRDGEILSVEVHSSSGHRLLDEESVETLRELGRLPAPPSALNWDKKRLRIPLSYGLK